MAAWITLYAPDVITDIDMNAIEEGVSITDWWTLGELHNITENDVSFFVDNLSWQQQLHQFELSYESAPVQLHLWNSPEFIQNKIKKIDNRIPNSIRPRLQQTRSILALELDWSQLSTMYEIVAFEVAYWLAENENALICSPEENWYDHDIHRWHPF